MIMRTETNTHGYSPTPCRRRHMRYKFYVLARLEWKKGTLHGKVSNISQEGVFIKVADPPPLHTRFSAYLALDAPLRLDCVVRHVVPRVGIGVSITVPENEKLRFNSLLLALAAHAGGTAKNNGQSETL